MKYIAFSLLLVIPSAFAFADFTPIPGPGVFTGGVISVSTQPSSGFTPIPSQTVTNPNNTISVIPAQNQPGLTPVPSTTVLNPVINPNQTGQNPNPSFVDVDLEIDSFTSITDDSAKANVEYSVSGINLTSSNQARITVKYGTSSGNLNQNTSYIYTTDEDDSLTINLNGLNDDTHYYARLVIRIDGEDYTSSLESFTTDEENTSSWNNSNNTSNTNSPTYSQPVSYASPTVTYTYANTGNGNVIVTNTAGTDIATLVIKNDVTAIGRGQTVMYAVSYKNISGKRIDRARLVVTLPSEMQVNSAMVTGTALTSGIYVIDLGSLAHNESDTVIFTGTMKNAPASGFITARATLTGSVNGQSVTIDSADADQWLGGAGLSASALFSGAGGSVVTILGILIIAGLIILLARHITQDRPRTPHQTYRSY